MRQDYLSVIGFGAGLCTIVHAAPPGQTMFNPIPALFPNPGDPSWIKSFAVLGDSYAAGIGAGKVGTGKDDKKFSRYDGSYGVLLNELLGNVPNFKFWAATGATTEKIQNQIKDLPDNSQDLVTISAGGNDALLGDVLKSCIYLPKPDCDKQLALSKAAIKNVLRTNVDQMLRKLQPKLTDKGIVLYTLYAQFFNADTSACDQETWDYTDMIIPGQKSKLTKDLRKTLNGMVVDANNVIKGAIADNTASSRQNMIIGTVEWDDDVGKHHGRFCEDGSKPDPNDPSNINMAFIRDNTGKANPNPSDKMRRVAESARHRRSQFEADAHSEQLERRVSIPDDIARNFHPSLLGHAVIAGNALYVLGKVRQEKFHLSPHSSCSAPPSTLPKPKEPTCNSGSILGIDKGDFKEARDAWCKDTSKPVDKSKKYADRFSFEFKKGDGGNCNEKDCVDAVNSMWNKCAETASRPDYDDSPLKEKYGPLRGDGSASTSCGTYSFKLQGSPPTPPNSKPATQATKKVLIIWDNPPVSGPVSYDFYDVNLGDTPNLDDQCGGRIPDPSPFFHSNDPMVKDPINSKTRPQDPKRIAPGSSLASFKFGNQNCKYEESTLGQGKLTCNGIVATCRAPDQKDIDKITPNGGKCGNIQNVRRLVMQCDHK